MIQVIDFFIQQNLISPLQVTCTKEHFDMDSNYFLSLGSFRKTKSKAWLEEVFQLLEVYAIDFSKLPCFMLESSLQPYSFQSKALMKDSSSSSQVHSCSSQYLVFSKDQSFIVLQHSFLFQVSLHIDKGSLRHHNAQHELSDQFQ